MDKGNLASRLVMLAILMVSGAADYVLAHQPKLVTEPGVVRVERPEVSQAFYAELFGDPAVYEITSPDSFYLYISILVPDYAGELTDLTVTMTRGADTVFILDGPGHRWTKFYEPFGGDSYLMGPEQRLRVGSGTYVATVSRPGNRGRYVLAVGEREEFTPTEFLRVIRLMPRLKRGFFHKASIRALTDPISSLFRWRK